jgi:hypothetical protein
LGRAGDRRSSADIAFRLLQKLANRFDRRAQKGRFLAFSKIQNPIHCKTLLGCRQCLTDGPKVDAPLGVCPSQTERVPNPHAD